MLLSSGSPGPLLITTIGLFPLQGSGILSTAAPPAFLKKKQEKRNVTTLPSQLWQKRRVTRSRVPPSE